MTATPSESTNRYDAARITMARLSPLAIDVVAPIAVYYLLHALGTSDAVALTVGAVVPGLNVLVTSVRHRRLNQMGLFVCAMFALSAGLLFVTGDARLILAKQAVFVVVAGAACLLSLAGRPAVLTVAKPMATHGNAELEALWETSWTQWPPFRRAVRASTAGFAIALFVDGVGRVVVAYTIPVSDAVVVANVPGLVALVLALVYHLTHTKPVFEQLRAEAGL